MRGLAIATASAPLILPQHVLASNFLFPSKSAGQVKPVGIPIINWRHPLAQGLVFYGYDMNGTVVDLAMKRQTSRVGTSYSSQATVNGQAINFGGGGGFVWASDSVLRTSAPFSYGCGFNIANLSTGFARPFGRTANNAGTPPYLNWDFEISTSGNIAYNVNSGGSATAFATGSVASGKYYTPVGVVSSASSASGYLNGALLGSNTGLTVQSSTSNDDVCYGCYSSSGASNYAGNVYWGGLWQRALTPAEAMQLHYNPYGFLIFPQDEVNSTLGTIISAIRKNLLLIVN